MIRICSAVFSALFCLNSQLASSQATAPAPRVPAQSLPRASAPPDHVWNTQASAPTANSDTGATSVLSVQLDTLREVLAMAMSDEDVKRIVDFEKTKFGKDSAAILAHRKGVVIALVSRFKEDCK